MNLLELPANDAGFSYDLESFTTFAKGNHSQAEIMTHMTRKIADSLIHKKEIVVL